MENYCPKCGSDLTFNNKNNKYTCTKCGYSFYEKQIYQDRKYVNENYYNKKTVEAKKKDYSLLILIVLGISVALALCLSLLSRVTTFKDFKIRKIGDYVTITDVKNTNKETLVVPSSATRIYADSFKNSKAKTIVIEPGLKTILSYSFEKVEELENVVIPKTVKYINKNSFYKCDKLDNVYYNGTIEDWCGIYFYTPQRSKGCSRYEIDDQFGDASPMDYAHNFYLLDKNGDVEFNGKKYSLLTELVIPESVKTIGYHQFSGFESLESVTIPETVKTIKYSSFQGCTNLKSVTINSKINSIPLNAFRNCTSLENVVLLDTVTQIEKYAFSNCSMLKTFNFTNIKKICNGAFSKTGFEKLNFADGELSIDGYAFDNCKYLTEVVFGYGIECISYNLFGGCSSLVRVSIPTTVNEICYYAFSECESLTEIEYRGTTDSYRHNVKNESNWNAKSVIAKIICIDGEIEVSVYND